MGRKWMWLAVCAAILIAVAGAAVFITRDRGHEVVAVSAEFSTPTPSPTPTPTPTPVPTPTPEPTPEPEPTVLMESCLDLDFDDLRRQNSDIYAWIDIPDMVVSYPMLQSDEDNYYLMRNLDGSYGYPGCIYTNDCDPKDFSGFCTAIYGHNMKDQSMFGSLHKYFREDFLKEHPRVYIYTPEKILVYRVAAAVRYDDRYISEAFDYETEEGRQAFIDSMKAYALLYYEDLAPDTESRVIVLCTCNGDSSSRDVILAVYEGIGVTAE